MQIGICGPKKTKKRKLSHEGAELSIPKQVFIYCKENSNDAKQSDLRLSHVYRKLFDQKKTSSYVLSCPILFLSQKEGKTF